MGSIKDLLLGGKNKIKNFRKRDVRDVGNLPGRTNTHITEENFKNSLYPY